MENNNEKVVKFSVRMPLHISYDIELLAKKDHRSINSLILKICDDYISNFKKNDQAMQGGN